MKFIKTFLDKFKKKNTSSFDTEEKLYKEFNYFYDKPRNNFSKSEFFNIYNFIKKNFKYAYCNLNSEKISSISFTPFLEDYQSIKIGFKYGKKGLIEIDKYPDEWYIITYHFKPYESSETGFYKCDTLDGVKQCLLDYKNNKIQ